MSHKITAIIILASISLTGCREGIPEPVEDDQNIKTGQIAGALYYSNFVQPESLFVDAVHEHIKLIDVNNDGVAEFGIGSSEDTLIIKDSNNNLRDFHVKKLFLRKHSENILISVESITYTDYVGIIQKNTTLNFENQVWNQLDSVKMFCQWERNIQAEFSYDYGIWNGNYNKYFAVNFQHGDETIIAWIEISVVEYDNYILHNYASFILE
jgi:hypothetical protein